MSETKQQTQPYLEHNYTQAFANLRSGEMEFSQFMALINRVYEFGFARGTLNGIERCRKELAAPV